MDRKSNKGTVKEAVRVRAVAICGGAERVLVRESQEGARVRSFVKVAVIVGAWEVIIAHVIGVWGDTQVGQ